MLFHFENPTLCSVAPWTVVTPYTSDVIWLISLEVETLPEMRARLVDLAKQATDEDGGGSVLARSLLIERCEVRRFRLTPPSG